MEYQAVMNALVLAVTLISIIISAFTLVAARGKTESTIVTLKGAFSAWIRRISGNLHGVRKADYTKYKSLVNDVVYGSISTISIMVFSFIYMLAAIFPSMYDFLNIKDKIDGFYIFGAIICCAFVLIAYIEAKTFDTKQHHEAVELMENFYLARGALRSDRAEDDASAFKEVVMREDRNQNVANNDPARSVSIPVESGFLRDDESPLVSPVTNNYSQEDLVIAQGYAEGSFNMISDSADNIDNEQVGKIYPMMQNRERLRSSTKSESVNFLKQAGLIR